MTYEQLVLEVAERVGVGDQTGEVAAVPSDSHDLDKVRRYVNAGYDEFLRADPRWTFLMTTIQVVLAATAGPANVGGDTGRLLLPRYISGPPTGNWRYRTANTAYPEIFVQDYQSLERTIELEGGSSAAAGIPRLAAHRPVPAEDVVGGTHRGWELLVWPRPSATLTAEADFRVRPGYGLVELSDRHVAGRDHDATIVAFSVYEWALHDEEMGPKLGILAADRAAKLAASREIDLKNRARFLGGLPVTTGEPRDEPRAKLPHMTFNGQAIDA